MRVVVLTRSDRPPGAKVTRALLEAGKQVVGVVVEKRLRAVQGKASPIGLPLRLLRQHGFRFLLERACESVRLRLQQVLRTANKPLSVLDVAESHEVPCVSVDDHNGQECVETVAGLEPDITVVVNARRLKGPIVRLARHACLNLHTSMLPKYAGLDSIFWALYHDEPEIGVTIHYVDEAIDAGDILLQRAIPALPEDDEHSLYEKAIDLGAELFVEAVTSVESATAVRKPQNAQEGSYFSWPTPAQRRELRAERRRIRRPKTRDRRLET